eukprot:CAMPEP_0197642858 /NCGR_PEP_ID=MMETSP1338-20131121/16389_1 /TAXON_ID=43686 ORGANISM="Pelagodinium beii, Strain RCC1491" /NCGR_SAMPLE_ID=MMETSP1338 /ASSEMBLY_ACC=CAM_ASM_000754 /LENGTH=153 /DNA_ID=CAMNT_0043216041 /DNA_START=3 /DNA_END=461 /DNA_ORIENTATION=+
MADLEDEEVRIEVRKLTWKFIKAACSDFIAVVLCLVAAFAWPTDDEACPSSLSPIPDTPFPWSTYFMVLAPLFLVHFVISFVHYQVEGGGCSAPSTVKGKNLLLMAVLGAKGAWLVILGAVLLVSSGAATRGRTVSEAIQDATESCLPFRIMW